LVCANTGAAKVTVRAKAMADNNIFISLLPGWAPAGSAS
jgi:hypothetical protein